jgi:hypothetical protein
MEEPTVTLMRFLQMTPTERGAMPLQQSSELWARVMARDLEEFERLHRISAGDNTKA